MTMASQSLGLVIFTPQMTAFGGVERLIVSLSAYLHAQNRDHTVVCFYDDISLPKYAKHPLKIVQLTCSHSPLTKAWVLARCLRANWRQTRKRPLLFGIKGAFNMGIFHACPFVLHFTDPPSLLTPQPRSSLFFRGILSDLRQVGAHLLTKLGTRRADCVITMTRRNAGELSALYQVKSVVLRLGGLSPVPRFITVKKNDSHLNLMSLCRLEPSKRVDWLIEAAVHLQRKMVCAVQVDVVGTGSAATDLTGLVEHLGLKHQVRFLGSLSDVELEEIFARASIFVMPAVQGYGLPALEALYRGVPVVLHRESGVSEILTGTPWVQVFDGGKQNLEDAIQMMMERVLARRLKPADIPQLPTESQWVEQISQICWGAVEV